MTRQQLLKQADADRARLLSSKGPAPDAIKSLRESFKINFISSGAALEEFIFGTENVRALNHDGAFDFMLQAGLGRAPVTAETIRTLHRLLFKGRAEAGLYRKGQPSGRQNGYRPPAAEELSHLMEHFIQQMEYSKIQFHPVEFAALCHKRLMDIQPFSEGNCLVAGMLLNLLLLRDGYEPLFLPAARKEAYLHAVQISQRPGFPDPDPLLDLVCQCAAESEAAFANLLKP